MDAVLRFAPLVVVVSALGCTPLPVDAQKPQALAGTPAAVADGGKVPADPAPRRTDAYGDYFGSQSTKPGIARPQAPAEPVVPAALAEKATTQVRVVALIGSDVVITDDEVWQLVRQRAPDYIRLTGAERDAKEKEIFQEVLRTLIERELILADFLGKIKKNNPRVLDDLKDESGKMASRQMRAIKEAYKLPSDAEFQQAMQQMGLSVKGLRRHLERKAMADIYLGQFMKDKGKGASLAEVKRYYDEHPDEFKVEDRVKWLDLFVSYRQFDTTVAARQYAEQVHRQAAAGADFVELVKKYGHGDSKLRDGEGIGAKRGEVQPRELEPTVFGTAAGEVSGLVATETGFHVVKVLERDVAGVRPFDEKSQTAIRNRLTAQVQKVEYDKLIEDLWRKTTVKVVETP